MRITFLGTGTSQGVPLISCKCHVCTSTDERDKRLRSAISLRIGEQYIVIDSGPDFRQQMLRDEATHLDAIVFTHEHKDHIAGLDDVRAFNFTSGKPVDVYCTEQVEEALRREFHYAFAENKYPGVPEIILHRIENSPFNINGINFTPIEVLHFKMKVFGYRIGNFTYITDANFISEEEIDKIIGSDVLVLNGLRREPHPSHFTFDQALALIARINPKAAYLTHISHQLGTHNEVTQELPHNVHLAYDGLTLELQ
jgi:phosphoribosyl 1,2-cyclic phosphate phosphodiesterase